MSFAAQTKKELTMIESESCCEKAELSALMRMNGSVQLSSNRKVILDISTENAAIARRIYTLVKTYFQVHTELLVRKKMRLKKNNVYIVRIPTRVQEILRDLHIVSEGFLFTDGINEQIVENNCCKRAYLRGAFMAGGSVNNPEGSSYHLEISSMYEEHCRALVELANEFQLNTRFIERKKGFVLYIKEGEKIIEFLNIIGAHQALFKFEDVRIMRDMRNSVNRIVNCETANLNKTIGAAVRQIENIRYLERHLGLEKLPDKLREVAEVRLAHPDINLKEVGELLSGKVSKSGVNHRLRKIDEMAERLRNG
ncbi:DNA-binding protein WhiA [Paenibacillus alvei]|uniref:Probable cell division protein WhiA n=1 Tax=Paenibacillus alvei TaxID=44250 RepID=A0ABT4H3D2_PAEAL|nr:DNA-binding protein WhiA [Paenibacillus alvei]MCY9543658.1 DNA-binding protein WhiA [Paenibacillus alvei]MCY9706819.1 DNA-binding protein WhiA [Paenibacillus alvei]MCY9737225.1 DNA-binding protein WhiA [Paenibacillus alvei]MCY9758182.1 DNA-binding protein WhiA [Paenibacillus alvei]MCY9763478.1 DNA-binding protein WhiA [Paenibacillus alvei]